MSTTPWCPHPPGRRRTRCARSRGTGPSVTARLPDYGGRRGARRHQRVGQLAGLRSATPRDLQNLVGDGRWRRILLRGASCSVSIRASATSRKPTFSSAIQVENLAKLTF